ncbi:shikimate kinase [Bradyrhizobium sp. USDA 10063]
MPASALQHYPRSEQVADEARAKAKTWLQSRQEQKLTSEELFRTVTAGHIDGPGAVAVPSGDGCLHVPTLKSDTLSGGVLIGRAPYDKPNLRPFAAEQVKSARDGDPTAVFLDSCMAIQYSFNVTQKSGEKLATEDPSLFAKGILIVVPDKMWPANYADRGLVMSAEDVKCHSSWTNSKDRVKVDTPVDCVGILQATEVFAPGSLIAVPPSEQKKLDGDFDGDTVVIVGDRPQLYEHVREFDQEEQARGLRSLKPPKSHTPAIEEERYQFSRARQILAATLGVLGTYGSLQRDFLAQSDQARRWFAERAIFGIYEGVHHELRRDIRELLNRERVSGQDIQDMLERASGDIETANHPLAREVAELLVADLAAWAAMADEQVLPETVESGSDANPILSGQLCELFPDLAEHYSAAPQPRDRIEALLDNYPARIDPRPDGYNPDDLIQSANNLLSLGIKVGTDAYKSDTGARLFMKKSSELQRLLQQTPGLTSVPYLKSIAAPLNQGRLDVDATLEDLKDNPTLAASIMETSIKLAVENRILPEPYERQPTAGDSAMKVTLTREEAAERAKIETSRAKAEEQEITTTTLYVAEALRQADIQINMPHFDRRLRSKGSMTDQLTGMTASSGGDSQLIDNAIRHVFEVPDKDFAHAFRKAILAFYEHGYAEVSTTNWFRMRNPAFVGVKTVLATQGDYRFEVEFHTPASYMAKVANHDTYKTLEKLQQQASGDALAQAKEPLVQRAREVCQQVAIPDGAMDISHWGLKVDTRGVAGTVLGPRAVERPRTLERSPIATEVVTALGTRPIVLVGLPAAGKSTIGSALARRLGLPFIESDKQIEKVTGMSIAEIFATKGEPWFTEREAEVIAQSLEKGPAMLAIGGGSFMRSETRDLVGGKAVSIWLHTDETEIWKRISKDKSRPLLQTDNPHNTFNEMVEKHTPHYRQADITFVPPHKRNNNKNADVCAQVLHTYLCGDRAPARGSDATSGLTKVGKPSDIYGGLGSLVDLPSTPHELRDHAHHARVFPSTPSDAQIGALDPTASSHGRSGLTLGPRDWLTDQHIGADYALLEQELQRDKPDLAARTRFVSPATVHVLRWTPSERVRLEMLQGIVGDHTARFLFLPVSDAEAGGGGCHWSLLFLDRHAPEGAVAYHYDSAGAHNSTYAEQLAARLSARLQRARMAQQQNDFDCGVFLVDATRALVGRLGQGERPGHEPLHLNNLVADRQALQNRLRNHFGLG